MPSINPYRTDRYLHKAENSLKDADESIKTKLKPRSDVTSEESRDAIFLSKSAELNKLKSKQLSEFQDILDSMRTGIQNLSEIAFSVHNDFESGKKSDKYSFNLFDALRAINSKDSSGNKVFGGIDPRTNPINPDTLLYQGSSIYMEIEDTKISINANHPAFRNLLDALDQIKNNRYTQSTKNLLKEANAQFEELDNFLAKTQSELRVREERLRTNVEIQEETYSKLVGINDVEAIINKEKATAQYNDAMTLQSHRIKQKKQDQEYLRTLLS